MTHSHQPDAKASNGPEADRHVETPTKLSHFYDDERFWAVFFSFFCPGLGQLYLGKVKSALWQFCLVGLVASYHAFIHIEVIYRRHDILRELGERSVAIVFALGFLSAFLIYWRWEPKRRPIIPQSREGWVVLSSHIKWLGFFAAHWVFQEVQGWYFHDIDWTRWQVW